MNRIVVFSGHAHPDLARALCRRLKVPLSPSTTTTFSNDCLGVQLQANCRQADVFIIQPLAPPVQQCLTELLLMLDAARGASAARITAVIPHFAYARSDKKDAPRISIAARLVADLVATTGANRVLAMTLHSPQVHGFFSVPVDQMNALKVLARHFRPQGLKNTVVVSPDLGNAKEASQGNDQSTATDAAESAIIRGASRVPSRLPVADPGSPITLDTNDGRTSTIAGEFARCTIAGEFARLAAKGVAFTQRPVQAGPVTLAVYADTCGNLIQLYQPAVGVPAGKNRLSENRSRFHYPGRIATDPAKGSRAGGGGWCSSRRDKICLSVAISTWSAVLQSAAVACTTPRGSGSWHDKHLRVVTNALSARRVLSDKTVNPQQLGTRSAEPADACRISRRSMKRIRPGRCLPSPRILQPHEVALRDIRD